MPKKSFHRLPYPPMVTIDQDEPIGPNEIAPVLYSRPNGVTLCIRSSAVNSAKESRGGYFFHVAQNGDNFDQYSITDFDANPIKKLDGSLITFKIQELCDFINHCTGSKFSEKYLILSQTEINFRSDANGQEEDS